MWTPFERSIKEASRFKNSGGIMGWQHSSDKYTTLGQAKVVASWLYIATDCSTLLRHTRMELAGIFLAFLCTSQQCIAISNYGKHCELTPGW